MWAQYTSETDRQTDRFTMTKTALCIAWRRPCDAVTANRQTPWKFTKMHNFEREKCIHIFSWSRPLKSPYQTHRSLAHSTNRLPSDGQKLTKKLPANSLTTLCLENRSRNIIPHNSPKCGPILIILLLPHSQMNCRKTRNKIYCLPSNLLPHYLA